LDGEKIKAISAFSRMLDGGMAGGIVSIVE
jgi:hypothetical protein